MKNFCKLIIIFFVSHTCCFAQNIDNKLIISLTNNTQQVLHFKGISGMNPNNTIEVYPHTILPHAICTIIGRTNSENDLGGLVHFKTLVDDDVIFMLLDQRQFHVGEPVFSILNPEYSTQIKSKTLNQFIYPTALMYVAADVEIFEH